MAEGGGLAPMIAAENQSSSLRAGSSLGQFEEAAGDGSVGGGNEAGGAGGATTTTSEPGERANYPTRERLRSSGYVFRRNRPPRSPILDTGSW